MPLIPWLRRWMADTSRPRAHRVSPGARFRPTLDSLEDRLAPASWTGNAGDFNWNTATNWSGNAVPTSADDVTISPAAVATINVTSTAFARSLNDTKGTLSIASGASLALTAVSATSIFGQNVTIQPGG